MGEFLALSMGLGVVIVILSAVIGQQAAKCVVPYLFMIMAWSAWQVRRYLWMRYWEQENGVWAHKITPDGIVPVRIDAEPGGHLKGRAVFAVTVGIITVIALALIAG